MARHSLGGEADLGKSASWRQSWGRKPPARHRAEVISLGIAGHVSSGKPGIDIKPSKPQYRRGKK